MTFNLLTEPWIPMLWCNGRAERVGIREALTRAGEIRQVASSNPLDNVALVPLLLAVLQWCKSTFGGTEHSQLHSAPGVPERWLEKLGTSAAGPSI